MTIEGRDSRWKEWYPTVVPDFGKLNPGESHYTVPNDATLQLFSKLTKGSKVLDVGGGDGRFALPLARMGHHVAVLDVHQPSLVHLKRGIAELPKDAGSILPLRGDATFDFPVIDGSFDAVLNTGFGYLIPPDELDPLVGRMSAAVRSGGLMVFEFATNRDRRESKDGLSLIGPNEYRYSHKDGMSILNNLFSKYGFEKMDAQTQTIHFEEPYYMHNDLIISHGYKR